MRYTGLALLALALVWVLPAVAGSPIDETRQVDKDATISIENLAGEVIVKGWNRSEVQITGTLDDKAEELKITGGGDRLDIEVKYPDRVKNIDEGTRLEVMIPSGCDLEISVVSADIQVDAVRGDVEIESVSGEVMLRGEPADLEVETVSGNLDIDVVTDTADVACVSGDIEIKGVRKELECAVVSGNITVDAGKQMEALECETVSGDVTVRGTLPRKAEWSLAAHSGDILLELSGEVDAEFSIESFSGEIHDAFGHQAHRTSKYAPGSELEFTEGDGSATVEIEVFSGDVKIKQR
jgi:DUF4097 and DUF4098 domain-containing protein YvlB